MDSKGFNGEHIRMEVIKGFPHLSERAEILRRLTNGLRIHGPIDIDKLAQSTAGFVENDFSRLTQKAFGIMITRFINQMCAEEPISTDWLRHLFSDNKEWEHLYLTMADFEEAAKVVLPSLIGKDFLTTPDVKWEDIGVRDSVREAFLRYMIAPIKSPDVAMRFGVNACNILLYGPSGYHKKLIAKAVASEVGAKFICVQVYGLLLDETESLLPSIFSLACACTPCIVFVDEVNALVAHGRPHVYKIYEQLQSELQKLDGKGVHVVGDTDRFEDLDAGVLEIFQKHVNVPIPSPNERGMVLNALCRRRRIDESVDLGSIGKDERLNNFTHQDLRNLVNEAGLSCMADDKKGTGPDVINADHFEIALKRTNVHITQYSSPPTSLIASLIFLSGHVKILQTIMNAAKGDGRREGDDLISRIEAIKLPSVLSQHRQFALDTAELRRLV